jgi:hypothetical protein
MRKTSKKGGAPEPTEVYPQEAHLRTMTKEKLPMYARSVSMRLNPNSAPEFIRTFENDVLPLLRKQNGFKDEITFVVPGGVEALGISLWDRRDNAETYDRNTYPQVLKNLAKVIEGTPKVQTYEVCNSTIHEIAAKK